MMASGIFPAWQEVLVTENFFETCSEHGSPKNGFCVDCRSSICPQCVSSHSSQSHTLLEIRQNMSKDNLRVEDCSNLMDCSLIQRYTVDSSEVVYIDETPESRDPQLRLSGSACVNCRQNLEPPYTFCSLYCKVFESKIPERTKALKNLPQAFKDSLSDLEVTNISVQMIKDNLDSWVWEQAKGMNEELPPSFQISDDGILTHLCWSIAKMRLSENIKSWRELMGEIRNQFKHPICWTYAGLDLISLILVIHGIMDEFKPLSTWFLSQKIENVGKGKKLMDHSEKCMGNSMFEGLEYVVFNGIPPFEDDDDKIFDCNQQPPTRLGIGEEICIDSVKTFPNILEGLNQLEFQAIGATLIVYSNLWPPGKRVYTGPKEQGSTFEGYHGVDIVAVQELDEDLVAVCRLSNGDQVVDNGYAYVSLTTVYLLIGADSKFQTSHEKTPEAQHLLTDFVCPILNEQTPEEKEKMRKLVQIMLDKHREQKATSSVSSVSSKISTEQMNKRQCIRTK